MGKYWDSIAAKLKEIVRCYVKAAKQQICAAKNTHKIGEELLEVAFSVGSYLRLLNKHELLE
jgi:NTP pyrophosphatase (non-canonical NTP hydrolase)